jgi:membrane protein required for colicin V production
MTVFDYVVLVIVGLSVIFSVWRGAIREVFALAAWIAAFFAAQAYAGTLAAYLPDAIPNASLRLLSGFVIVFLTVLVLTAVVAFAISKIVRAVGLGPVDRGIGAIFGLLRGMLVVLVLVLLCGLTSAPQHPVWREAMLSPPLEAMAVSVRPWLPEDLSQRISYE